MSELIRKAGVLTRRSRDDIARYSAPAASTERVSFDGEAVTWADFPARTRRAARRPSPLLAEEAERDVRVQLLEGRRYELATGWRVFEDAVVLANVRRPLRPASGGALRAAGPWEHRGVRFSTFAGPLRRRSGFVTVAEELQKGPGGVGHTSHAPDHANAAEAWTYLPRVVREAAERLVPEPDVWLGEIMQRAPEGGPWNQTVRVLRMSAERAVVVLADRSLPAGTEVDPVARRAQLARTPWLVEQVGADLGAAPRRIGAEA